MINPTTVVKAMSAQTYLNGAASTITNFLRNPAAENGMEYLAQSYGPLKIAVGPLQQLGHTKLAARLLDDVAALKGAFIGGSGPGKVPNDLVGIRNRILEGVSVLHFDIADAAKIPNFR
ncbi:MAG: hypothetical protein H7287_12975 [Thermoleophilia bacterium]|nr:hypothetical protein [Thermoleophilia bacterium]